MGGVPGRAGLGALLLGLAVVSGSAQAGGSAEGTGETATETATGEAATGEEAVGETAAETATAVAPRTTGDLVVTVHVVDGTPPLGVEITLTSPVDPRPYLATVDPADGRARFEGLLPGTYTVVASGERYRDARTVAIVYAGRRSSVAVGLGLAPDPPREGRRWLFWRRGV